MLQVTGARDPLIQNNDTNSNGTSISNHNNTNNNKRAIFEELSVKNRYRRVIILPSFHP